MNPDALLEREAQMLGREATLLGHTVTFHEAGAQHVQTLVYELAPLPTKGREMIERRWAVYIDGQPATSGILNIEWKEVTA